MCKAIDVTLNRAGKLLNMTQGNSARAIAKHLFFEHTNDIANKFKTSQAHARLALTTTGTYSSAVGLVKRTLAYAKNDINLAVNYTQKYKNNKKRGAPCPVNSHCLRCSSA